MHGEVLLALCLREQLEWGFPISKEEGDDAGEVENG